MLDTSTSFGLARCPLTVTGAVVALYRGRGEKRWPARSLSQRKLFRSSDS